MFRALEVRILGYFSNILPIDCRATATHEQASQRVYDSVPLRDATSIRKFANSFAFLRIHMGIGVCACPSKTARPCPSETAAEPRVIEMGKAD